VIKIETKFSPVELFKYLKKIETELGRKKSVRWSEREIDLDILLYNDLIYKDEKITIPHIGIAERDFVLRPLSEIAPDFIHPVLRMSMKDLSAQIEISNIIDKVDSELLQK